MEELRDKAPKCLRLPFPSVKPHTMNSCCGRDLIFNQSDERFPGPNKSGVNPGSNSAHRVSLFADRLRREGLITHNQRTGMLEITQQGIDYLDQAS